MKQNDIYKLLSKHQIPFYELTNYLSEKKLPFDTSFWGGIEVNEEIVLNFIKHQTGQELSIEELNLEEAESNRKSNQIDHTQSVSAGNSNVTEYITQMTAEEHSNESEANAEEVKKEAAKARKEKAMAQMLITSGFNFEGYTIKKYCGYISGDDAISVDRGSAWEEVTVKAALLDSLSRLRRNALQGLKEAAYELGCNAIIGVDYDYITLDPKMPNKSGGTTFQPYVFCVTANGNAVIIEKDAY